MPGTKIRVPSKKSERYKYTFEGGSVSFDRLLMFDESFVGQGSDEILNVYKSLANLIRKNNPSIGGIEVIVYAKEKL